MTGTARRAATGGKISAFANLIVILAAGGLASCTAHQGSQPDDQDVPMAVVERTDLQIEVNTTGDLRATQTGGLAAPAIAGGGLQIIRLLKTGSPVKAGEVVVEFDPSEQEYTLSQNRSDLQQAEQEIVKAKDDALVQTAEDQTALLKAQFAVRQAELDVSKSEIVSVIDAKKNQLTLDEARRALAQLQQDIQSHSASNQATIAVDQEKSHKADLAMKQAQQNIDNMRVKSPITGLVVVRENQDSTGGFFFSGMSLPEYQEGDQVNPGNIVAEVIDISQMEIGAKVSESGRGNVRTGEAVEVSVDALPGGTLQGKVTNVAGMSGGGFFDSDSEHKFDLTVKLDRPDDRLRPGFTTHLVILGDRLEHALSIPRQAVFEKDGKPVVYLKTGNTFQSREIKIRDVTEGFAVIEGLQEGTHVALIDPGKRSSGPPKPGDSGSRAMGSGAP